LYSVVLIDLKNEINLKEFNKFASSVLGDYEVLYCSSEKANKTQNIYNYVFGANENTEKILNTILSECNYNNIIVVRNPARYKEISKLLENFNSTNEIVYLQKKMGKFKSFWNKFIKNFIGKIFAQKVEPIDFSIVLYGGVAGGILKRIKSPSILMKSINFTGINFVCAGEGEQYKFDYKKTLPVFSTLTPFSIAVLMIVLKLAINFYLYGAFNILYISIVILLFLLSFVFGSKWILKSIFGDNITDKAKPIQ